MSMSKSGIQYADFAWNPVTGCRPGLPCAARCRAAAMHRRFHPGEDFGTPREHPERLDQPMRTRRSGVVAVSFGGDLFADGVSMGFLYRVFGAMENQPRHTFLVLTKRPERMAWLRTAEPRPNIILGTSVSTQAEADERIPHLMDLAAKGWRTWVSVEPMLGPVDLSDLPANCDPLPGKHPWDYLCALTGTGRHPQGDAEPNVYSHISWVVCGSESGPGARPMNPDWARSLRDQCATAGTSAATSSTLATSALFC